MKIVRHLRKGYLRLLSETVPDRQPNPPEGGFEISRAAHRIMGRGRGAFEADLHAEPLRGQFRQLPDRGLVQQNAVGLQCDVLELGTAAGIIDYPHPIRVGKRLPAGDIDLTDAGADKIPDQSSEGLPRDCRVGSRWSAVEQAVMALQVTTARDHERQRSGRL